MLSTHCCCNTAFYSLSPLISLPCLPLFKHYPVPSVYNIYLSLLFCISFLRPSPCNFTLVYNQLTVSLCCIVCYLLFIPPPPKGYKSVTSFLQCLTLSLLLLTMPSIRSSSCRTSTTSFWRSFSSSSSLPISACTPFRTTSDSFILSCNKKINQNSACMPFRYFTRRIWTVQKHYLLQNIW